MKAIVAMDLNRVIGYKNKIPWHIADDYKWFNEFTMDKTLIVGRKTFDGLPKLKGRDCFVVTTDPSATFGFYPVKKNKCGFVGKFVPARQISEVMESRKEEVEKEWIVAGGAQTYSLLLPYCSEIYVSHIIDDYEGDTFMPEFESQFPNQTIIREEKDFWIVKYTGRYDYL
jgi:dihydrofolate reductase